MTLIINNLNRGAVANDGTGDTLYTAAGKINDNFSATKTAVETLQAAITNLLSTALTGFSAGAGTISATDSILSAFNKIVGNLAAWRVPAGGGDWAGFN